MVQLKNVVDLLHWQSRARVPNRYANELSVVSENIMRGNPNQAFALHRLFSIGENVSCDAPELLG